jgi:hypothetical protein
MKVRRYENLEVLPEGYGALFQDAERESFFNSAPWYHTLLSTAWETGNQLHLYGLEESGSGRPLALLPAISSQQRRSPFGARVLSGWHNVYTLRFSPLFGAHTENRKQVVFELIGALAAERPNWDVISLCMLDRDSDIFGYLLEAFADFGMVTEPYFQFGNWYEQIGGRSFDTYLADRGKSVKKTVAWKARRFARRADAGYEVFSGGNNLERAMAAFKQVYATSWKEPERYPTFIDRLMRICADRGTLRLGNLYLNDAPVATWLIIVSNGIAVGFKTAYDPSAPSSLSVGGVLTYNVMQHLIDEEKVSTIDFGIGDEAYKTDWLTKRRERWGILAYNRRTPKGLWLGSLAQGRALTRRFLRRRTGG